MEAAALIGASSPGKTSSNRGPTVTSPDRNGYDDLCGSSFVPSGVRGMLGLRSFTRRKALALVVLGGAAFGAWQWNEARLRQEFIAEIERQGGKVQIDDGILYVCTSAAPAPPPPPPTFWDHVTAKFEQWRRKGRLKYVEVPSLLTRRNGERMRRLATVPWLVIREADDEALVALPAFPELEMLTLHSTNGTDASLAFLQRTPKLTSLELHGRAFTDATLLVAHPRLDSIDVSETSLSESSFAALATCPRRLWLTADRVGVTGSELLSIPATKITLGSCGVAGNPLTDQVLTKLYTAPQMTMFDGSNIEHGPAACAALATNQTLTALTLNDIRTDWAALTAALAAMPELTHLSLQGAQLKPEHLKKLLRTPKLQQLKLERSNVTSDMYYNVLDELDRQFYDNYVHHKVIIEHLMYTKSPDEVK